MPGSGRSFPWPGVRPYLNLRVRGEDPSDVQVGKLSSGGRARPEGYSLRYWQGRVKLARSAEGKPWALVGEEA